MLTGVRVPQVAKAERNCRFLVAWRLGMTMNGVFQRVVGSCEAGNEARKRGGGPRQAIRHAIGCQRGAYRNSLSLRAEAVNRPRIGSLIMLQNINIPVVG